jgi:hypothetical protein
MSEWESVFGEGVSAESVIDGINASWSRSEMEAAKEGKEKRFRESMAYRTSEEDKAALITELSSALEREQLEKKRLEEKQPASTYGRFSFRPSVRRERPCTLASLLGVPEGEYAAFGDKHRIPESLVRVINAVFSALVNERSHEEHANKWLIECFRAIKPGSELRFIPAQLEVTIAAAGMVHLKGERNQRLVEVARAAFDILCAKARGVSLHNGLLLHARHEIEALMGKRWGEPYSELQPTEALLAVLACALDGETDGAVTAAAEAYLSPQITGDVDRDIGPGSAMKRHSSCTSP